jgi:hypothetical protein
VRVRVRVRGEWGSGERKRLLAPALPKQGHPKGSPAHSRQCRHECLHRMMEKDALQIAHWGESTTPAAALAALRLERTEAPATPATSVPTAAAARPTCRAGSMPPPPPPPPLAGACAAPDAAVLEAVLEAEVELAEALEAPDKAAALGLNASPLDTSPQPEPIFA